MGHVLTVGGLLKALLVIGLVIGVVVALGVAAVNYMSRHWQ
jgi:hypothetical protein